MPLLLLKTKIIAAYRWAQFYLKMSLVGAWCTFVSLIFYVLSYPFNHRTWLAWAYAQALNAGVRLVTQISVTVAGRENMQPGPAVILMNHQSNFDPLLQGPVFPKNAVIIGKKELLKIPFWGRLFSATNNILVERGVKPSNDARSTESVNRASGIEEAIERLKNDSCYVWIFPEGTRSHGQGLGRFKRGAFVMAIEAQVPIIPMVSKPMQEILDIQNKVAKGGEYQITILPAVSTAGMTMDNLDELVERCEALYHKQLALYAKK